VDALGNWRERGALVQHAAALLGEDALEVPHEQTPVPVHGTKLMFAGEARSVVPSVSSTRTTTAGSSSVGAEAGDRAIDRGLRRGWLDTSIDLREPSLRVALAA
jgi:hypothetical protein